jgi:hypothetical protein
VLSHKLFALNNGKNINIYVTHNEKREENIKGEGKKLKE